MRVTGNILSQNLLSGLQKSSNKMIGLQNSMSTGKRINKPSDDPAKISAIMGLKSNISSMDQWKTNASEALDYMSSTESSIANMTSILQRVRNLAVQAANGTNGDDDLDIIKKEVDELSAQLKLMANSQVGTKYIFSGTKTNTAPFTEPVPATNPFTWDGNTDSLSVEVGANTALDISVDGEKLFGFDSAQNLFETLRDFSTALGSADSAGIQTALGNIDGHLNQFVDSRAELGAKMSRLERISDNLDSTIISAKTNLSNLQDTDMAAAIMDYNTTMNSYRAALSIGAQIIQPSLVDFIS